MQEVDPEEDQRAGELFDKLLDIAVSSHSSRVTLEARLC
jgi:hypothetical protein